MLSKDVKELKKRRRLPSGAVIALGFIALILIGSLLLFLPISNRFAVHGPREFFDCVFTAVSCICVTGLSTVSVHDTFTVFGQAVMMLLIQLGGLGFMTAALLVSKMIRRRITPKEQLIAAQAFGFENGYNVRALVFGILRRSLVVEGCGALLLFFGMGRYTNSFILRIWYSLFHSVSAFCNAGFDLFDFPGGSITGLSSNAYLLTVLMVLIFIGGVGFMVWDDVLDRVGNRSSKISIYTKFVLSVSLVLFFLSSVTTFIFERDNPGTIGEMPLFYKIVNSAFHAVSLRTAGFASVPNSALNNVTKFASALMMFIGGCSGSTAGGVKVGTVGLIALASVKFAFGRKKLTLGRRTIDSGIVIRAFSLFFISLVIVFGFSGALIALDAAPAVDLVYETVSAFGTVGLSAGLTPGLSYASKCLLIVLMYFGRVGILTVTGSLTLRSSENDHGIAYPNAVFYIG